MIQGSMVALVTPMAADGSVDRDALYKLLDWHVDQGTSAIVSMGTTGNRPHSTSRNTAGDPPYRRAYCGPHSRRGRYRRQLHHRSHQPYPLCCPGRCGCLPAGDPYYNKPTQEGLYLHYKAIAEAVDIPRFCTMCPAGPPVTCCQKPWVACPG